MPELWATVTGAVTTGLSNVVTTITGNAVLLLSIAVPFVGACIGLAKRLLRFGGRRGR